MGSRVQSPLEALGFVSNKQLAGWYYNYKEPEAHSPLAIKAYQKTYEHIRDFKRDLYHIYMHDRNLRSIDHKGLSMETLMDLEDILETWTRKKIVLPVSKKKSEKGIHFPAPKPFVLTRRTLRYGSAY